MYKKYLIWGNIEYLYNIINLKIDDNLQVKQKGLNGEQKTHITCFPIIHKIRKRDIQIYLYNYLFIYFFIYILLVFF